MQVVINGAILCLTIVINTDELPFTNCMYLRHSHPSSSSGKIPVSYTQESVALFRAPNISTDVFFSRIYSQEKRTSSPHFHNSFSLHFFFWSTSHLQWHLHVVVQGYSQTDINTLSLSLTHFLSSSSLSLPCMHKCTAIASYLLGSSPFLCVRSLRMWERGDIRRIPCTTREISCRV